MSLKLNNNVKKLKIILNIYMIYKTFITNVKKFMSNNKIIQIKRKNSKEN